MILTSLLIIALIVCFLGVITDLKKRWVPDYYSFFLVGVGLFGSSLLSLSLKSWTPFLTVLASVILFYGFSSLMYYSGQWGGGDAKLLVGLVACVALQKGTGPWPYLVSVFFSILLVGVVYTLIWSIALCLKNAKEYSLEFKKAYIKNKNLLHVTFLILFIFAFIALIYPLGAYVVLFSMLGVILIVLYFHLKAVEECCMYHSIDTKDLVEGDLVCDFKIKGWSYEKERTGLSKKNLKKIKALTKIKYVTVKEGVPYVPVFFISLILSLYIDLMYVMLM